DRPVTPAAIDHLLQPRRPGIDSAPVLGRLVNTHFAHTESGRYYLHPVDRKFAISRITDSPLPSLGEGLGVRAALFARAADYFRKTRLPRAEWKNINDLAPQLHEFDLRCQAGDYDTAARVLTDIDGEYLLLWGHYRTMISMHERLQEKIQDVRLKRISVGNLGQALAAIGEVNNAIECYKQSLSMAREAESRQAEGVWLGNLGLAYADLGETRKAIEYHQQALEISREIGDRRGEGADLGSLGNRYAALGETRKAIKYYQQALEIAREIGDRRGEGNHLSGLAACCYNMGQTQKAIEYQKNSLAICEEIGDRDGEGASLSILGSYYMDLGIYDKAKKYFESALIIASETGYRYGEGFRLANLAGVEIELGNIQKAIGFDLQAEQIAKEISRPDLLNNVYCDMSIAYLLLDNLSRAEQNAEKACQYKVPTNDHNAQTILGIIALRQNEPAKAQVAFNAAITHANEMLVKTPENYDALDAKGLALCGVALCADGERETGDRLEEAREAFCSARAIMDGAGHVGRVLRLFDALAVVDREGVLGRGDEMVNCKW
ncbi:MAG: tetratricopeptide repeat protein, partial [Chloroflexota bacterium]|nr:tetratricopeptide repeat protein [Chloroflexota bacterium]